MPTDSDCTTSSFAPIVDIVFGGIFGMGYINATVWDDLRLPWYGHTLWLGLVATSFASAASGTRKISDCQDYHLSPTPADTTGLGRAAILDAIALPSGETRGDGHRGYNPMAFPARSGGGAGGEPIGAGAGGRLTLPPRQKPLPYDARHRRDAT